MNELNPKKLRFAELLLVILLPFLGSVIQSVYIFTHHEYYISHTTPHSDLGHYLQIVKLIAGLALLFYVLYRQGRRFEDIGFTFRWLDLLTGLGIFAVAYLIHYGISWCGHRLFPGADWKPYNLTGLNGPYILAFIIAFINPFYEELIVRAYGMTEVEYFTGSKAAAIIIMTLFQSSYHLYQGLIPALMTIPLFLIYSLYFARYKKIMPVIIAHLIADMVALVYHANHSA